LFKSGGKNGKKMVKVVWDSVLDIYVMASDFRPGTEYNDGISKF